VRFSVNAELRLNLLIPEAMSENLERVYEIVGHGNSKNNIPGNRYR
jgi:hypothetical protein